MCETGRREGGGGEGPLPTNTYIISNLSSINLLVDIIQGKDISLSERGI